MSDEYSACSLCKKQVKSTEMVAHLKQCQWFQQNDSDDDDLGAGAYDNTYDEEYAYERTAQRRLDEEGSSSSSSSGSYRPLPPQQRKPNKPKPRYGGSPGASAFGLTPGERRQQQIAACKARWRQSHAGEVQIVECNTQWKGASRAQLSWQTCPNCHYSVSDTEWLSHTRRCRPPPPDRSGGADALATDASWYSAHHAERLQRRGLLESSVSHQIELGEPTTAPSRVQAAPRIDPSQAWHPIIGVPPNASRPGFTNLGNRCQPPPVGAVVEDGGPDLSSAMKSIQTLAPVLKAVSDFMEIVRKPRATHR
eukprot:NODE_2272_length_1245_cov_25.200669_g2069_i0.p1 GENE.NODE_2272_length_1245_cov_25.200669_g2069_i0~~NODE_2272_length_1245_cov_25.200669_g2069_i0.p1  ORF type:complete len:309 (+),score=56.25 NODE_2272_length_1245_cov_25.200669_g2069_i0:65-991(+)